jgi:transcriptional regulator with XRE-family HTH domain
MRAWWHDEVVDLISQWQAAFGERLRRHRKLAGWSQERLAQALSVDRSLVSRWESGDREPGLWGAVGAARTLGIPVSTLAVGSPGLQGGAEIVWREIAARGAPFLAAGSTPLWALRPLQDSVADALLHPDPRVIEHLPGLLLLETFPPRALWGLCADWGVERRLGWIADIALGLARTAGVARSPAQSRLLADLLEVCSRPAPDAPLDSLGFPASEPGLLPPVFKRWRIAYDGDLARFEAAAKQLADGWQGGAGR